MKTCLSLLALLILLSGCTTEKNYVTNNAGPADWQPPVLTWQSLPDAEVRGTVGLNVSVSDSSAISMVKLYVDGSQRDSLSATPYRFSLHTDSLSDGVHLCEARAWDQYGNLGISPILRVNVMNSVAQGPRLLWVPDSFATIQAAINAAMDYDTIRVRDGFYYETLNLFGKGAWVESERGPSHCTIDVATGNNALFAPASRLIATVRGFHFANGNYTIYLADGSRVRFVNNLVISDSASGLLITSYAGGEIINNLFSGSILSALQIGYHWGDLYNNVIEFSHSFGLWNAALSHNPLSYGYNLLWQNQSNYMNFEPGIGDLYSDPMLDLNAGRLQPGSPCIDAGKPDILDKDSSRSDIGPFGGPYAY